MFKPKNGQHRSYFVDCKCGGKVGIRRRDTVLINGERKSIVKSATCSLCIAKQQQDRRDRIHG